MLRPRSEVNEVKCSHAQHLLRLLPVVVVRQCASDKIDILDRATEENVCERQHKAIIGHGPKV